MNKFSLEGRITHLAKAAREISDKFRVREFVVEIDGESDYPQLAKLQCTQDKCDLLDDYAVGDTVKVDFDIRGRQNTDGRVFSNLQAWRIAKAGISQASSAPGGEPEGSVPFDGVRGVV